MTDVSGNRSQPLDHQPPKITRPKKVGLARITYFGSLRAACSCGWQAGHTRPKVLEDKIDAHLAKQHQGRGIRV